MNAIDLALATGAAMTVACGLLLLRRRRARARLDRLSRHRKSPGPRRGRLKTDRLPAVLVARPGPAVTAAGALAGGLGLLAGGPVAGALASAYATVGLIGVRRHLLRREADHAVAELLDAIEDAVGDLRAGVVPYAAAAPYPGADLELYAAPPPPDDRFAGAGLGATVRRIWDAADQSGSRAADGAPADRASSALNGPPAWREDLNGGPGWRENRSGLPGWRAAANGQPRRREDLSGQPGPTAGAGRQSRRREDAAVSVALARLEAAHRVSEALGTPLADLLDQVEADLRSGQALRLNLAAQTSGAQTTTTLLVGLPVAGLWLGAGIGVDPVGQLLHTPLGAACALTAVALQCAGLLWTGRMVRSVVAEVR